MAGRGDRWLFSLSVGVLALASGLSPAMCADSSDAVVPTLTGSFTSVFDVDPLAAWDLGLASELQVTYTRGTASATLLSVFDEQGWQDLGIRGMFVLGAADLLLLAEFDPAAGAFDGGNAVLTLNILGVVVTGAAVFEPGGAGVFGKIMGQDLWGSTVSASWYFNVVDRPSLFRTMGYGVDEPGCGISFTRAELEVIGQGLFLCPDLGFRVELSFTDTGWESLSAMVYPIQVPAIPWLGMIAHMTFTLDEKQLSLTLLPMRSGTECLTLIFTLESGGSSPPSIESVALRQMILQCGWMGVTFLAQSDLQGPGIAPYLTTRRDIDSHLAVGTYWESYRILSQQDACCGPVSFELAAYFKEGGLRLGDLSALQAAFSIQFSESVVFGSAMEFDFEQPLGQQWVYWDSRFEISF